MKKRHFTLLFCLMTLTAAVCFSAEPNAAAVSAFQGYLDNNGLRARWADGPMRTLESPELSKAYGNRQFLFTYKGAPLPPGAPMPELIARHKLQLEEYRKHSLRLTVGIDGAQKVTAYQKAADFNTGLMPVKNEVDAKTATAAILSLMGDDKVHPEVVSANQVTVTATRSGWIGKASRPRNFDGQVVFDPNGKVVSATKRLNYVPPMPP